MISSVGKCTYSPTQMLSVWVYKGCQ